MIKVFIFSYSQDQEEAVECVRSVLLAVPGCAITVADDLADPVSEETVIKLHQLGVRYVRTAWPRHGNLRGRECIRGILSTMAEGVDDEDIVVKVDCDTVVLDGDWIRWMDGTNVPLYASGDFKGGVCRVYGCCYAIKGWLARRLLTEINWEMLDDNAPEDWTIGKEVFNRCPVSLCRIVVPWRQCCPWSDWTAWNWYSRTADVNSYAARFAVVTVGNPRQDWQIPSERASVMRQLIDGKERLRLPFKPNEKNV